MEIGTPTRSEDSQVEGVWPLGIRGRFLAHALPAISRQSETGFSSPSPYSWPTCHRCHRAELKRMCQSEFGLPCCLRPWNACSAFAILSHGHLCFQFPYGPKTRRLPQKGAIDRLHECDLWPPCCPGYKTLILAFTGRSPAEHTGWRLAVGALAARLSTRFAVPHIAARSAFAIPVSRVHSPSGLQYQ